MKQEKRQATRKSAGWFSFAKAGFTMIEILVAVALFSIVITAVADVYLSIIGSQRRAFGQQDVLDSSRFALESMARAVRQSTVISANGSTLEIQHPSKGMIEYTLQEGIIMEDDSALTAEDVTISSLNFIEQGLAGNDNEQPRITVTMTVQSQNQRDDERTTLSVQTTITPRKLQIQP